MPKRFSAEPHLPQRALQIYLILIGAAYRRETITYTRLGKMLGYPRAGGVMADRLGPVMMWCAKEKLPALTAIVVNDKNGLPGGGLTAFEAKTLPAEQQKVFKFDWFSIFPPSLKDLGQ